MARRTQGEYAQVVERAIRTAGLNPDAPEAWPIWDVYEQRGHAAALHYLAIPAGRTHTAACDMSAGGHQPPSRQ